MLEAVGEILIPDSVKYIEIVNDIESSHLHAAKEALNGKNENILAAMEQDIKCECSKLRSFMAAAEVHLGLDLN